MRRSTINTLIREAITFFDKHQFRLPPFAHWTPEEWKTKGPECDEIRKHGLGWDLTDLGSGDFFKVGLLLFTIRNGDPKNPDGVKNYAEKIMIVREMQVTPWHYHWFKTEDIINRGGGNLVLEIAWMNDDETGLDSRAVTYSSDGVSKTVPAGSKVVLSPGESITLPPKLCHTFYGEEGKGTVLVGEVSR
ncbi:MAG: D-lyxose/D-mannose family sugar isomerase, partial [Verrucomicrobiae bacterium]|nr:D-lyxose/D-mannose family sugar isomerase [Verrucomicrobiae bacterium]